MIITVTPSPAHGQLLQTGDNVLEITQEMDAESGDASGGNIIVGVVSRGTTHVTLHNTSRFSEVSSGDARSTGVAFLVVAPVVRLTPATVEACGIDTRGVAPPDEGTCAPVLAAAVEGVRESDPMDTPEAPLFFAVNPRGEPSSPESASTPALAPAEATLFFAIDTGI